MHEDIATRPVHHLSLRPCFSQELTKERPVEECCKGYAKTTDGERCIPICSQDCRHGTCVAPDVCKCESGYGGPLCDYREYEVSFLLPDRYITTTCDVRHAPPSMTIILRSHELFCVARRFVCRQPIIIGLATK